MGGRFGDKGVLAALSGRSALTPTVGRPRASRQGEVPARSETWGTRFNRHQRASIEAQHSRITYRFIHCDSETRVLDGIPYVWTKICARKRDMSMSPWLAKNRRQSLLRSIASESSRHSVQIRQVPSAPRIATGTRLVRRELGGSEKGLGDRRVIGRVFQCLLVRAFDLAKRY